MAISKKVSDMMTRASWIRKMFEEGNILKKKYGAENIYDYTLGNPIVEPPQKFVEELKRIANNPEPGSHRYMTNVGYQFTREAIAKHLIKHRNLNYTAENVIMTVGAGGAMNVVLKAILNEGEEVIVLTPYFVEYLFYIDNHGGKTTIVHTDNEFQLDVNAIEKAITKNTKALIINYPNNPTGVIYRHDDLKKLGDLLNRKTAEYNNEIYLISDEPYKRIIFKDVVCPNITDYYNNTIVLTSFSKDLALPGERIGYIAIHPEASPSTELFNAMAFTVRTLGFVNSPAIMQRAITNCLEVTIDVSDYENKCKILYDGLTEIGYDVVKPEGTFYIFPKSPIDDDVEFCQKALKENLLLVPGSGFGRPGYFRIAYCCLDEDAIKRSLSAFKKIFN